MVGLQHMKLQGLAVTDPDRIHQYLIQLKLICHQQNGCGWQDKEFGILDLLETNFVSKFEADSATTTLFVVLL